MKSRNTREDQRVDAIQMLRSHTTRDIGLGVGKAVVRAQIKYRTTSGSSAFETPRLHQGQPV